MKRVWYHSKLFWLIILLLISFSLYGAYSYYFEQTSADKGALRTEKAELRDLDISILATGVVQPQNRLEIKPPIAGRIESVLVEEGEKVKQGQILAWMSSTERAAMLDAARARGAKELEKWKKLYRPTPIMAPIDGMVIQKNIEPGQTFTSSEPILILSDRLTINSQVDETDIGQIKVGQSATVNLDAYSQTKIKARVDKIAFEATTINNVTTYIVELVPETVPDFMLSGMTANVTFHVAALKQVLSVSSEALKVRGEDFYLLILPDAQSEGGMQPEERFVRVGLSDGKWTQVLEGLKPDDVVVLDKLDYEQGAAGGSPFSPFGRRSRRK